MMSSWPITLQENQSIFSEREKDVINMLLECDQQHLFSNWEGCGVNDNKKHAFLEQVMKMHESYPSTNGLVDYISNARNLLNSAKLGANPLEGWIPEIPEGVSLDIQSDSYLSYEKLGLQDVGSCGFVLVAGGLGERLGYSGIKIELPSETTTNISFMELYCRSIKSLELKYSKNGIKLPLAIMVSDDTYSRTISLLERNNYFGLDIDQVTIMKQEKVAAIVDNVGHIALASPYLIDSKPHGHGDVHALMYSTGTAIKWLKNGIKWVYFFQDTNGLAFNTLAAQLGVSVTENLEVNSMTIPRKAKQAVGAITRLVEPATGNCMTVNVEYNQLDPLLRATIAPEGDVNDINSGYSLFPGNINELLFMLEPYIGNLNLRQGIMAEFVNPKYADSLREMFKKPTRLECMMQDYPKILDLNAKVGFTSAPAWICYAPCKNNSVDAAASIKSGIPANSAYSAECEVYASKARLLELFGVNIEFSSILEILGIPGVPSPQIIIHPSTAIFACELKNVFPSPQNVTISARSTLVIEGDIIINRLHLDGYLHLKAPSNTSIIVDLDDDAVICNEGQQIQLVDSSTVETVNMRGFSFRILNKEEISVPIGDTRTKYLYSGKGDLTKIE